MKKPDFIVVGEARCGSTSLYEYLIKHPMILPSCCYYDNTKYEHGSISLSQKEIRFFDKNWYRGPQWYFDCFEDVPGTITGEASATYLYKFLSMQRIGDLLPTTKIIILLRNPINRLFSHYNHIRKFAPKWKDRYESFEHFIESFHENDYHIIDRSIYVKSISMCLKLFPKPHIIKSEDLFENHQEVLSSLFSYLEIKDCDIISHKLRSSGAELRIDEDIVRSLKKFYDSYNEELYELIGRDLGWA